MCNLSDCMVDLKQWLMMYYGIIQVVCKECKEVTIYTELKIFDFEYLNCND